MYSRRSGQIGLSQSLAGATLEVLMILIDGSDPHGGFSMMVTAAVLKGTKMIMTGAVLTGINMKVAGAVLKGINMMVAGAVLKGTNMIMTGAVLKGAVLKGAVLTAGIEEKVENAVLTVSTVTMVLKSSAVQTKYLSNQGLNAHNLTWM